MKLIIHIGSDKCGSTAIQTSLALNRELLLKESIYVPVAGFGRASGHAGCFEWDDAATMARRGE